MGVEFLAFLIPLIAAIYIKKAYKHEVTTLESFCVMFPAVFLIPLGRYLSVSSISTDYERHGGWAVSTEYYEDWNEYIHRTCTRTVGSGDKQTTETYDCSYVDYHPEYWIVRDSNGYEVSITQEDYSFLKSKFVNSMFVDMHRYYHTDDGDMYRSSWDGLDKTFHEVTTTHKYENKTQVSNSVYTFPEVTDEEIEKYSLIKYPEEHSVLHDSPILGRSAPEADKFLKKTNALFGGSKQIRFWLVFINNQPIEAGFMQESLWGGGNKNEFVVVVGTNDNKIVWCHPFCWSPEGYTGNDMMKERVRDFVLLDKNHLNPLTISQKMVEYSDTWRRKNFSEFDFLYVPTPKWAVITIYFLVSIGSLGVALFAISNEHKDYNVKTSYSRR